MQRNPHGSNVRVGSQTLLGILTFSLPLCALAAEPAFDAIDYSKPEAYLEIPATLGTRESIVKQAAALKGRDAKATVQRVLEWMDTNLTYKADKAYVWRNFDDVVDEGCYGGCADQAIVCGVLLKAAGVPTAWVKTMDVAWIWDFKKNRPFTAWSGHVFLEVYMDGKWVLLDVAAKLIYPEYSPKSRILPGNRFAYDKGNDPKQMVMSLQWEEWKEQTRTYFEKLDVALLPVETSSAVSVVRQVYIIGNSPYYGVLTEMARAKGWLIKGSFNTEYEKHLPQAKGHTLIVETHRGVPIVASAILEKHFPKAFEGLGSTQGVVDVDGTTILFVDFAKVLNLDDRSVSSPEKAR